MNGMDFLIFIKKRECNQKYNYKSENLQVRCLCLDKTLVYMLYLGSSAVSVSIDMQCKIINDFLACCDCDTSGVVYHPKFQYFTDCWTRFVHLILHGSPEK